MSTTTQKLLLPQAQRLAARLVELFSPHSDLIDIAGSVRREKPEVGDIEIVCYPKKIQTGFLGLSTAIHPQFFVVLSQFKRLLGKPENPDARYFKYEIPCEKGSLRTICLDLFIPQLFDYYRQLAIRTGSSDYSKNVIATGWRKKGWVGTEEGLRREEEVSKKGDKWVCDVQDYTPPPVWKSEQEFFEWLDIKYLEPKNRQ